MTASVAWTVEIGRGKIEKSRVERGEVLTNSDKVTVNLLSRQVRGCMGGAREKGGLLIETIESFNIVVPLSVITLFEVVYLVGILGHLGGFNFLKDSVPDSLAMGLILVDALCLRDESIEAGRHP